MPISPTAEGFRAACRRPSFTLAEISWRWAVGATATVLFFFGFFEYLDTLPVSKGEMLLLKSRQPYLVSQAIAHILRGSMNRAVMSMMLAALLLAALWIVAASLGRIATVRAMLDYVRERLASRTSPVIADAAETALPENFRHGPFGPLIRLSFLRVSLVLATLVAFVGASILAGFISSTAHPRPFLVFVLFLPLAGLVGMSWFSLNWLLSLAAIFAVRDGDDAAGAIVAAVGLCRERFGAVFAVSTWTGLAHLVAFVGATTVVSIPLGMAGLLPWRLVFLGVAVLTLAYFAIADWIYTARLAGYVVIAEMPEVLLAPMPPTWPQFVPPAITPPLAAVPPLQTTIDRDELILSDVPDSAAKA